ncbi:hypothetical protein F444_15090 [Phytophthora nicotianae P1976]|uniref:Uncharacterized protein n=1 Tax=Phytophthora nicotianae P1976 TaxID=1317066 RepID=A0A080ZN38_PHYNI|nr:hypothetical protein F444_15090 [Phytophthora nicotianae P1976]
MVRPAELEVHNCIVHRGTFTLVCFTKVVTAALAHDGVTMINGVFSRQ